MSLSTHTDRTLVRPLAATRLSDVADVGGKNAGLGELHALLGGSEVRVPDGFAVTAAAYRHTLRSAGAWSRLTEIFADLDPEDADDLAVRAKAARDVVERSPLPDDLVAEITAAYRELEAAHGPRTSVAVRSSATAEDLPEASFAGQHDSYLGIAGEQELLDAVRRCFASAFTARGVHYRARHGYEQLEVALSVGVMTMVPAASSGVTFTLDPESGHRGVVLVSGAYGVGENVVQGRVEPDEFHVHKATYDAGFRAVLHRRLGAKEVRTVVSPAGLHDEPTPDEDRRRFCIDDTDVLDLAGAAIAIERHFGRPMDIEWAADARDGRLYVVQARPATGTAERDTAVLERFRVVAPGAPLTEGRAVGDRAATGRVRVIRSTDDLASFRPGEVLVSATTTPDWEPVLKTAAAVVTDRGGRTCHAAIVARELGLPAVVGTGDGTTRLHDGDEVTVSCAEGEVGHVYAGTAEITTERIRLDDLPRPRTKVMVNLGNPSRALATSLLPCDGVGLARTEFIFSESVRVHPLAALHPERVADPDERARVEDLIAEAPDGAAYVVRRLAEGVGMIAAAFHPRPVVVRMSDFKTNEYADLVGGAAFEPHEDNPMIGFRGASRYAHPAYAEGFALECEAMRRVREEMGLTNVVLMLPFVRRIAEADLVLDRMAELGLERGHDGLQVYAMCEIPNNVVLVDDFATRFDGLSIGSNDLTQLTLGVDRDSDVVAFDYDDQDPGVRRMIELAIQGCRRNGIHSGICGQAPSDHPEMAAFLVRAGIDSMSLSPDSLLRMLQLVHDAEAGGQAPTSLPPARTWDPWCSARETHSGAVVLLGDRAYKVKKPVSLGFLDFSDRAVRRRVCEREVELNRRLAPDVYLGVGDLGAPGEPPEPVVVMRRLPEERRLSTLVRSGQDVTDELREVARTVAAFHTRARTGPDVVAEGTREALGRRWEDNLRRARAVEHPALDEAALDEVTRLERRFLAGRGDLFEDRIRRGAVVDGHGDLTADDVFCLEDGPRLLDCLEFDDHLRYVDRLDDIAFLAMGLDELGAPEAAAVLIDSWAEALGDPAPASLVHHYVAYRAFVRAEVAALQGAQDAADIGRYLATALAHLRAGAVTLVLVGGPPASGKSTLAGAVADRFGMVVLSSDRIRKELAGIDPQVHAPATFGTGIYTPEHTRATYAALVERAERLLRRGESVVLDATWSSAEERQHAVALAERVSADLVELRCRIDESTAARRMVTRHSTSDADADVAARMRELADPWPTSHEIDTGTTLSRSADTACSVVRPHPVPALVPTRVAGEPS